MEIRKYSYEKIVNAPQSLIIFYTFLLGDTYFPYDYFQFLLHFVYPLMERHLKMSFR